MTVPPESALWMEGSKDGAISVPEPSPLASEAAIFVASSSSGRMSTIARAVAVFAGALIWIAIIFLFTFALPALFGGL